MLSTYSSEVHTPDALHAQFAKIYELVPDAILVGSLGRSAIYNFHGVDPSLEFDLRRENPLSSRHFARDIDLAGVHKDTQFSGPFPVDTAAFSAPDCALVKGENGWSLVSEFHDFFEPIDAAVMAPVTAQTVLGIPCVTVPVQTHKAIHGMHGPMRRNDMRGLRVLDAMGANIEETIPDELYEPFRRLASINRQGITPKVLAVYRRYVPTEVDRRIAPKTHFIGQALRKLDAIFE